MQNLLANLEISAKVNKDSVQCLFLIKSSHIIPRESASAAQANIIISVL